MTLTHRKLHARRARTIPELYRELKEWLEKTADPELGYSLTFLIEDAGSTRGDLAGKFNLHSDARREAIQIFVDLYRKTPSVDAVFQIDQANSSVRKRCVRLMSEKPAATGFYNHCVDP